MSMLTDRMSVSKTLIITSLLLVCSVASQSFVPRSESAEPRPPSTDGVRTPPLNASPAYYPSYANCRYGVTAASTAQSAWVPLLGAGWFLTYGTTTSHQLHNTEFVPVIWLEQNKDENGNYLPDYWTSPALTDADLGVSITANPGALWIVGNEVDRGPNPGRIESIQGDTFPEVYALAYHDIYHFIKHRDPTAQVTIAGLVEVTPGRLQYLDIVWETYLTEFGTSMPADVWNMHLYILPEARPNGNANGIASVALGTDASLAIRESGGDPAACAEDDIYCWAEHDDLSVFAEQVVAMRTWMQEHGYQNKPLIITEYSILYPFEDYDDPANPTRCFLQDEYGDCFTQSRVSRFMAETFAYLESAVDPQLGYPLDGNRLVQQWNWFSVNTTRVGYVSNLVTYSLTDLTLPGQTFRDSTAAQPSHVNLLPDQVAYPLGFSPAPTGTVTVTLSVSVRNNGNTGITTPFTVTFYSDAGLTQPIGSAAIPSLGGCARPVDSATTSWAGLSSGLYNYWVKIDSQDTVAESDEADNVIRGSVIIDPRQIFLPLVRR